MHIFIYMYANVHIYINIYIYIYEYDRVWDSIPDDEDDEKEMSGSQVLKKAGNINVEWHSRSMASHAQMCTDLISTDTFVASSSKSGQIFRWAR
jgi:hypothetical protein